MRRRDAEAFVRRWHEDFPVWLDETLRSHDLGYRNLTESHLNRLAPSIIVSTPLRFAECVLKNKPEHGGGPWRLLPFQKEALEYPYHIISKSAAGTGKTREILALCLHTLAFRGGSFLYAANSSTARDEIWDDLLWQIEESAYLKQIFPDEQIKRSHPKKIFGPYGNKAFFLRVGYDGAILRSVHVGKGFLCADEAAVWHEKNWPEFFRRAEQGTYIRIYSVPDGRRTTKFYRLSERAIPLEVMRLQKDAESTIDAEVLGGEAASEHVHFARIHWTRPEMGPPFWTDEEKAKLIEQYEGEDTPGYQRYVLGLDGNPDGVVFPWGRLSKCFVHVPEYRVVRAIFDDDQGVVRTSVSVARDPERGQALYRVHSEEDRLEGFDLSDFVRSHLPAAASVTVAGADFGLRTDPTIILFFEKRGETLRLVAQIYLRGATADRQRQLLCDIETDSVYTRPEQGWGLEASGASTGASVEHEFRAHVPGAKDRIQGYSWRSRRPLIDPESNKPLRDSHGHERARSTKEAATVLLEELVDFARLQMHPDPELIAEWTSHSAREGAGGRVFDNRNDHSIEAARVAILRLHDGEQDSTYTCTIARTARTRLPRSRISDLDDRRWR